ncbi:hypothetical protein GYMLUDRAFT_247957 [Collybiopsis luxurians FD-317 M1]|uniref:Uncharacterized protein n=1 Tax=Collybiopsis luxurians FD-317 M1 TaxID=944289 RepID=A0A0D0B0A4_9AGAR|nr:hypothetical protein GYMLUDRAFT_247957 [Collybiopsis luxurians FD-317 M1]
MTLFDEETILELYLLTLNRHPLCTKKPKKCFPMMMYPDSLINFYKPQDGMYSYYMYHPGYTVYVVRTWLLDALKLAKLALVYLHDYWYCSVNCPEFALETLAIVEDMFHIPAFQKNHCQCTLKGWALFYEDHEVISKSVAKWNLDFLQLPCIPLDTRTHEATLIVYTNEVVGELNTFPDKPKFSYDSLSPLLVLADKYLEAKMGTVPPIFSETKAPSSPPPADNDNDNEEDGLLMLLQKLPSPSKSTSF